MFRQNFAQITFAIASQTGLIEGFQMLTETSEPLARLNVLFTPGFSLGIRAARESSNRFNGFRKIREFLCKPLKRLTSFPSALTPS